MKYAIALIAIVLCIVFVSRVGAQNPSLTPSVLTIPSSITHTTTCPTPVAGSTFYCWAGDGLWESDSGAAYFRHLPAAAGVTSVNGKTGAVVLGATTTLQ